MSAVAKTRDAKTALNQAMANKTIQRGKVALAAVTSAFLIGSTNGCMTERITTVTPTQVLQPACNGRPAQVVTKDVVTTQTRIVPLFYVEEIGLPLLFIEGGRWDCREMRRR